MAEIVLKLVEQAQRLVKIGLLVLDGGFYDTNLVKELDRGGIRFIIWGPVNESVKRLVEENNLQPLRGVKADSSILCVAMSLGDAASMRSGCSSAAGMANSHFWLRTRDSGRGVVCVVVAFNSRFGVEPSCRDGRWFRCRTMSNRDNFWAAGVLCGNHIVGLSHPLPQHIKVVGGERLQRPSAPSTSSYLGPCSASTPQYNH